MAEQYSREVLSTLLGALAKHEDDTRLMDYGDKMFGMYTDMGFPPDMFLTELEKKVKLSQSEKIFIVSHYQTKFLEHRRKSGVQEKNVDKIRRKNREDIERFIETGELSIY